MKKSFDTTFLTETAILIPNVCQQRGRFIRIIIGRFIKIISYKF